MTHDGPRTILGLGALAAGVGVAGVVLAVRVVGLIVSGVNPVGNL